MMPITKRFAAFIVALWIPFMVHAGGQALFGLQFGMTVESVAALISLNKEMETLNLSLYSARRMPLDLPNIDHYALVFSNNKLVGVSGFTNEIVDDPEGVKTKLALNNIEKIIKYKFKNFTQIELKPAERDTFNKNTDELSICALDTNCDGKIPNSFSTGMHLSIQFTDPRNGNSGPVRIIGYSVPEYYQATQLHKKINILKAALSIISFLFVFYLIELQIRTKWIYKIFDTIRKYIYVEYRTMQ